MIKSSKQPSPQFGVQEIQILLEWFEANARELPWRVNKLYLKNPYAVWISEVMSQQSTLAMMLPFFERWMKRFPTLEKLASTPLNQVEPYWAGLGYYSRVRNLHKAAVKLWSNFEQRNSYPRNYMEWLSLPGVGPYTAAAVCAICFDQTKIPIDGNVVRVFSRFLGLEDPLNCRAELKQIELFLAQLETELPDKKAGQFAQALMDLGATVCRPRQQANCGICPMSKSCDAFRRNQQFLIPFKKKRPQVVEIDSFVPIYKSSQNSKLLLLRMIPSGQRLAGQWSLPAWEIPKAIGASVLTQLSEKFEVLPKISHSITCHRYRLFGVKMGVWPEKSIPLGHEFFHIEAILGKRAMPRALTVNSSTKKILNFLVDSSS